MINHRSAEVRVKPHHHYGFKEAKCGEPGKIKLPRKESNLILFRGTVVQRSHDPPFKE